MRGLSVISNALLNGYIKGRCFAGAHSVCPRPEMSNPSQKFEGVPLLLKGILLSITTSYQLHLICLELHLQHTEYILHLRQASKLQTVPGMS
jgi:hypothetical protein